MPAAAPIALHSGFLAAAEAYAQRNAVEVGGQALTYGALRARAAALAAALDERSGGSEPPLTAVFGQRSAGCYAGVLAALFRGHGYVPLNPAFPAARTRAMLERSGARAMVADRAALALLGEVLESHDRHLTVVIVDGDRADVDALAAARPAHAFVAETELAPAPVGWTPTVPAPESTAYLLFTSGSTGQPKGVGVTHANVTPFIRTMAERYAVGPEDRFSQTFDLTFDLSVFDLFVAWERGACVCCPTAKALLAPGGFIRASALTIWFSVPSLAALMTRLGMLKAGRYPSLRWSLFCGEALPAEIAQAWSAAAPASVVENLYGPTEVTIACTAYRWDPERSPGQSEHATVPIGWPLDGMRALVVDDSLVEVPPGQAGELLMAGRQVTPGYWSDPERTAAAFVVPPGHTAVHYRTGDRVRRPVGDDPLRYLGRLDDQIKVHGHRVELGEVEAVLREESRASAVAAVAWPLNGTSAAGIVAFVGATGVDVDGLRARVAARLPAYMVPRQFEVLDALPRNVNGKIDRRALRSMLEGG